MERNSSALKEDRSSIAGTPKRAEEVLHHIDARNRLFSAAPSVNNQPSRERRFCDTVEVLSIHPLPSARFDPPKRREGLEKNMTFMNRIVCTLSLCAALLATTPLGAQELVLPLWPKGAPETHPGPATASVRITPEGEHVVTHLQVPSITPYLPSPETATGAAVLVIPGGGHAEIWMDHEGYAVAGWLRDHGVAAFILQYRLAREKGSSYTVEGTELGDTKRALRYIRSESARWKIDPQRIGVIGFSAGGELAELASTRSDDGRADAADPIDRVSSRTNFQALLYPGLPHDLRLTAQTPPAFLACGAKDRPEISQGLPRFYLALAALGVPAELHVYAGVGHGFGIRSTNPEPVVNWPVLFLQWMRTEGLLSSARTQANGTSARPSR